MHDLGDRPRFCGASVDTAARPQVGDGCRTADNQHILAGSGLALPSSAPSSAATLAPASPPLCSNSLLPQILCPFELLTRHTVPRLVQEWLLLFFCSQHKYHPGGFWTHPGAWTHPIALPVDSLSPPPPRTWSAGPTWVLSTAPHAYHGVSVCVYGAVGGVGGGDTVPEGIMRGSHSPLLSLNSTQCGDRV